MIKIGKDQNGFGMIESLLAVIAVILLIGVGFYIAHSSKDNETVGDTTKISQEKKTAAQPIVEEFTFKELGLKITLPDDLKGLTYSKNTFAADEAYNVTTPQFTQLAAKCGESAPEGFTSIYVKSGQYPGPGNEGANGLLKQLDDRYVAYGDSLYGNPCEESLYAQLSDARDKLVASLKTAFESAKEVEAQ